MYQTPDQLVSQQNPAQDTGMGGTSPGPLQTHWGGASLPSHWGWGDGLGAAAATPTRELLGLLVGARPRPRS